MHKETWISPDGKTKIQIDHIMIDKKHANDVMDVRSYRSADVDSDHFLVIMKYRQKVTRFRDAKGTKQVKFKVKDLLNMQRRKIYQSKLTGRIASEYAGINEEDIINSKWAKCKSIILKTAEEVVGKEEKRGINDLSF